jgi:SAM-dependent methyltransferase
MIEIRHDKMDKATNIRQVYDQIYQAEGILHHDSFYNWLINLLQIPPGSSLIDIACGEGRLVSLAQKRGIHAAGIDFSYQGVRLGRLESPGANWLVGEGEHLPLASSSFDYLTNIGSLEHFFSPERGAQEMARILKPGGKACVLVPNSFGVFGNIMNVAKKGDVFDDGQPLQRYGTRCAWECVLEGAGLKVERVEPYHEVMLNSWQDLAWLLGRPKKLARLFLSCLLPINLVNNFTFICRAEANKT